MMDCSLLVGESHGCDSGSVEPAARQELQRKTNLVQEPPMSAPSRRPEIRRRRTRNEKIVHLRKRLAAAKTDADRDRITAKLHKLAVGSPGQPLLK
jgi:hypothetical protein